MMANVIASVTPTARVSTSLAEYFWDRGVLLGIIGQYSLW
jgi:hypothetical protein